MSDTMAPDDSGQGMEDFGSESGASFDSGSGGGTPLEQNPSPFFEIEDEKGKKYVFNSPDELKEKFKDFGMLRSDYTRKTQSHAEAVKEFERMKQEHEEYKRREAGEILKLRERYDKYEKKLKENPHIARQLKTLMEKGTTGDVAVEKARAYVDEKLQELQGELEEHKKWRKQREMSEYQNRIFDGMKQKYPDFSQEQIQAVMQTVDPSNLESLVELVYHASRGRSQGPAQQARMAEAQQRKQAARVMPGNGAPVMEQPNLDSLDEARELAMRDLTKSRR